MTKLSVKQLYSVGGKYGLVVASTALAFFSPFQSAQAVIIDFESLEQNNDLVNDVGFTYSEDGFTLTNTSNSFPFGVFGTLTPQYPGSTALFNNAINGETVLTRDGGGLFDLNSIQLTSLNGDQVVTIEFTGTRADSSTVNQSFTTDLPLATLETFVFNSSFTNLLSVSWDQITPFHQFDNIDVVPSSTTPTVPEPSTLLGLLSLGLLGIGSRVKQK